MTRKARSLDSSLKDLLQDVVAFTAAAGGLRLRSYQRAAARAAARSVLGGLGDSLVVIFPRQSGKNELQAQLETYLLVRLQLQPAEMVKISPTWKPQSLNAMHRLERALQRNLFTRGQWARESGYIYRLGQARITFLSGAPEANIVGATAGALLSVDEAQDVSVAKYDKEIAPMAASTNATRLFWGTAWSAQTLLGRELRLAAAAQAADGRQRIFQANADDVAAEVPAYAVFVAEQVRRFGRGHPLVRTQYYSEELDAAGGLFTALRLSLMQGDHPGEATPQPGGNYALLVDVGGEAVLGGDAVGGDGPGSAGREAGGALEEPHDATAATLVRVEAGASDHAGVSLPRYCIVWRAQWVGAGQAALYARLYALAQEWGARWLVVDATGVGAGLASFLEKALPGRVLPFVFSQKSKSELGWAFLAAIETGRYREPRPDSLPPEQAALQALFWEQARGCQARPAEGPGRLLRWGAPDGARRADGSRLHDDLLISAALCAALDRLPWGGGESAVVSAQNPFDGMDEVY